MESQVGMDALINFPLQELQLNMFEAKRSKYLQNVQNIRKSTCVGC